MSDYSTNKSIISLNYWSSMFFADTLNKSENNINVPIMENKEFHEYS